MSSAGFAGRIGVQTSTGAWGQAAHFWHRKVPPQSGAAHSDQQIAFRRLHLSHTRQSCFILQYAAVPCARLRAVEAPLMSPWLCFLFIRRAVP